MHLRMRPEGFLGPYLKLPVNYFLHAPGGSLARLFGVWGYVLRHILGHGSGESLGSIVTRKYRARKKQFVARTNANAANRRTIDMTRVFRTALQALGYRNAAVAVASVLLSAALELLSVLLLRSYFLLLLGHPIGNSPEAPHGHSFFGTPPSLLFVGICLLAFFLVKSLILAAIWRALLGLLAAQQANVTTELFEIYLRTAYRSRQHWVAPASPAEAPRRGDGPVPRIAVSGAVAGRRRRRGGGDFSIPAGAGAAADFGGGTVAGLCGAGLPGDHPQGVRRERPATVARPGADDAPCQRQPRRHRQRHAHGA